MVYPGDIVLYKLRRCASPLQPGSGLASHWQEPSVPSVVTNNRLLFPSSLRILQIPRMGLWIHYECGRRLSAASRVLRFGLPTDESPIFQDGDWARRGRSRVFYSALRFRTARAARTPRAER